MELELYKKTAKSIQNPYGIKLCQENPFLKGPTLMCISAQGVLEKSVFGIVTEGMKMARLRTGENYGAGYVIDNFPADFIAIKNPNSQLGINELVDKYLCPLVINNHQKIDIKQAKKNIRNLNIMTFCNGSTTYQLIEERLVRRMREVNYQEEEIKEILNECAFIPICTSNPYQLSAENPDKRLEIQDTYATTFQFLDITDLEIEDETYPERLSNLTAKRILDSDKSYEELLEIVKKDNPFPHRVDTKNNKSFYYYIGNGEHELKEYTNDTSLVGATISKVITYCLENSIKNSRTDEMIPLDISQMTKSVKEIIEKKKEGASIQTLFSDIDTGIDYLTASKINQETATELFQQEKDYLELYTSKKSYYSGLQSLKQSIDSFLKLISVYEQETSKKIAIPKVIEDIKDGGIVLEIESLEENDIKTAAETYEKKGKELFSYAYKISEIKEKIIYQIKANEPKYKEILIASDNRQYVSYKDLEEIEELKNKRGKL